MEETGIYNAAVYGDFEQVRAILLKYPAAVNEVDRYEFTPLHGVAGEEQFEMLELLLEKGANVNAKNDTGTSPLHLAAYPEVVSILVANGAEVGITDDNGYTPLHAATEHPEMIDIVEALLKLGANVNTMSSSGLTPLDIAMERMEQDKVSLLKQHGGKRGNAL